MNLAELKKEQLRLAPKVVLQDTFSRIRTLGGIDCSMQGKKLVASVVVCEFPSFKILEKKTYTLPDPLPYAPGFQAYREMPAMIEAYNLLENEPDVLVVSGEGLAHPRKLGMASHLGLALQKTTVGVAESLSAGEVQNGKIILDNEIVGFEIRTREHSHPIYVSPGHLISLGSVLHLIPQTIKYPHKMPEPLHLARKVARKEVKEKFQVKDERVQEVITENLFIGGERNGITT